LRGQTVEPSCPGIVAVGGLDVVALLDEDSLLELVVEEALEIAVAVVLAARRDRLDAFGAPQVAA